MKTLVVGAGGGGIASALLASMRGEDVTLVEAHSYLGGCASYFKRGSFCFDVGATTVSGLAPHEPLGILFSRLGKTAKLFPADPGIIFHLSDGRVVHYYRDFDKWMGELHRHFPHLAHEKLWREIYEINNIAWKFLAKKNLHPRNLKLLFPLMMTTELKLNSMGFHDPFFRELVDGILLISAQAKADKIPFLVGAMALAYPAETYAPLGGMKGLMDFFEEECQKRNINIRKKTKVTKVKKNEVLLEGGETLQAEKVILNLPLWNLPEVMPDHNFAQEMKKYPETWGAFAVYVATKSRVVGPYHQIHLKHPDVENYFVSFSLIDDHLRAPEGWQTVTISTHVRVGSWFGEDYQEQKQRITQIIMDDFLRRFGVSETKFLTAGTPRTFQEYTGRKSGFVGGIPFLYGKLPLLPWKSKIASGLYRVGDTTFPGQGLCGVVAGALELENHF